jgi:uncharacterized Zn finger protein (UPF0148 family)
MKTQAILLFSTLLLTCPAVAQEVANSRAEIANQRIQAEVEMRRRAEEEALDAKQQAAQQSAQPAASQTRVASTAAEPVKSRADMSRTLQQIRTLGELRDSGYVTEDEFQRIKKRILEGAL